MRKSGKRRIHQIDPVRQASRINIRPKFTVEKKRAVIAALGFAVAGLAACDAQAQATYSSNATSGAAARWALNGNWDTGVFPNASGAVAIISSSTSARTIPLTNSVLAITVGSLELLNSADTATISAGTTGTLFIDAGAGNNGLITADAGNGTGGLTISAPITFNGNTIITNNNTSSGNGNGIAGLILSGGVTSNAATTITKEGIGNLTISSTGTGAKGTIQVNAGALRVTSNRIPNVSTLNIASGGQFQIDDNSTAGGNFNLAAGGVLNLNGSGKTGGVAPEGAFRYNAGLGGGAFIANFNSPVNLQSSSSIYVETGMKLNFAAGVTGSNGGTLTKMGPGTVVLNHDTTYDGPTIISAGTLQVDNAVASTAAFTVNTGATLSGVGSIAGPVEIQSAGKLNPGDSPGTITMSNGLKLDDGSVLNLELGTGSADQIKVTGGTLFGSGIGGVTVNLIDAGGLDTTGQVYTLIDATGATLSGVDKADFVLGASSPVGGSFAIVGDTVQFTTSAVPEPASVGVLALGGGLLALRRRRGARIIE